MVTSGPPERWQWEHRVGLRWLLRGDVDFDDGYGDFPLALCAEIDGVFVDLPPWPRERFTFVGCTPDGALADVLDRLPAEAWLGTVSVSGPPFWWGEDLGDMVVLGQRPSSTVPGTVDIDLDGFVHVNDRTDAVVRPENVDEFVIEGAGQQSYGTCRDVVGLFREQAAPPVPQVRLLGCQPEPRLLAALDGSRRPRIVADVYAVVVDGSVIFAAATAVSGTVEASEPSRHGAGLLDVTVASVPREPLPTSVLEVLDVWRTGRPTEKNLWARYGPRQRSYWAALASNRRPGAPDRPPGTTYDLDGRFVTDIEGFYCAIGEAINGASGYFGSSLGDLDECLRGGYGAWAPFRLVWHNSAVARKHLVADRRDATTSLDDILNLFAEHHIEVDLR